MTTFPAVRSRSTAASTRPEALALLVGGPLSLAFHALWRIGHGPTVVNEHGVVLGLTNDQWSHLAGIWAVLVAIGVVAVCRRHGGRLSSVAGGLTVTGLALGAVASWVYPLYSVGAVVQYVGMLLLGLLVLRRAELPRVGGMALLVAVALFLPTPVRPDLPYVEIPSGLPFVVQLQDLTALGAALAWVLLGTGLARSRTHRRTGHKPTSRTVVQGGRRGIRRGVSSIETPPAHP